MKSWSLNIYREIVITIVLEHLDSHNMSSSSQESWSENLFIRWSGLPEFQMIITIDSDIHSIICSDSKIEKSSLWNLKISVGFKSHIFSLSIWKSCKILPRLNIKDFWETLTFEVFLGKFLKFASFIDINNPCFFISVYWTWFIDSFNFKLRLK